MLGTLLHMSPYPTLAYPEWIAEEIFFLNQKRCATYFYWPVRNTL